MKRKVSILTVVLIISLFISIAYSSIPNAHATELTNQQKAISTLNNLVGIDVSKYEVSTTQDPQDTYKDNLPRENIRTLLDTEGSKVDTVCSFIDGSLEKIYVLSREGSPRMNALTTSDAAMAQNFFNSYQAQSKSSVYGELKSILAKTDAAKNASTTLGDIKLNITVLERDTTFRWTYMANGIEAPDKCVILRYTDGFLNYFIDDWNLYPIGSTTVNLSEKDAIELAMDRAKNYSPDSNEIGTIGGIKFNVTNAMVLEKFLAPAVYAGDDAARSEDSLELYPMYNVWVSLDKFYPGNVYGFNVYIWADTKEVYYINQRISTIDPPADLVATGGDSTYQSDNQTATSTDFLSTNYSIIIIILSASVAAMFVLLPIYLIIKKKPSSLLSLPKVRYLKISGLLLCLLIFAPLLITISAQPVAGANVGGASVWGAESTGARNPPGTGESWRKSNSEVSAQRNVSSYIDWLFDNNGYISTNNQGSNNSGSNREAILSKVSNLEQNYPRYAVVDFDHGVGISINNVFHYMFEDNIGTKLGTQWPGTSANGNTVYDYNVYGNTTGKAFFAFINTCMSADYTNEYGALTGDGYPEYTQGILPDGTARGMAFAWTHREVAKNDYPTGNEMSRNGYGAPDNGNNCYIGFNWGSAALDQTIQSSDYHYYYWVYHFFHYALECDYTIHSALDLASQDTFYNSPNFNGSPLYTGFTARWPMYINGSWQDTWEGTSFVFTNCHLKVYGNSYLKLYQPKLTLSTNPPGLTAQFTLESQSYGTSQTYSTGNHRVISDDYTVTVNDNIPGYSFAGFTYQGTPISGGQPADISIEHDGELVANYVHYSLTVSKTGTGTTNPASGTYWYQPGAYAQVIGYPGSGMMHYWSGDVPSESVWNPTLTVLMDRDRSVQANFVTATPYSFVSYVSSASGAVYSAGNLCGPYTDGQYASISAAEPYGVTGQVGCALYWQSSGHIYVYGYGSGPVEVYTSAGYLTTLYPSGSAGWIDCGATASSISGITFVARSWAQFYLDCVKVDPTQYTLTISSSGNGYTTPSGSPQYIINTYANVQATAYSGYVFDHWVLDSNNAGNNPSISVYMDGPHSLQAVFVQAPPAYVSSVSSYGGTCSNPNGIVGSNNDGQYATITGFAPYYIYGYVSGALNSQTAGTVSVYGYGYGGVYVYVSSDGSNWNLLSTIYPLGTAGWINCGTYSNPINYVSFTVPGGTMSAQFNIDAVHVQP